MKVVGWESRTYLWPSSCVGTQSFWSINEMQRKSSKMFTLVFEIYEFFKGFRSPARWSEAKANWIIKTLIKPAPFSHHVSTRGILGVSIKEIAPARLRLFAVNHFVVRREERNKKLVNICFWCWLDRRAAVVEGRSGRRRGEKSNL